MSELTQEKLKAVLAYDAETGIFTWAARGRGRKFGQRAGSVEPNGYRSIRVDGVEYLAQRLAWFYVNGEWPRLIRFQNGNRDDCRIDNLREGFYLTTKHDHRTKEGKAAYQVEYRSMRREELVAKERERKFGISMKDYCDLLLVQDGKCAICRQPETATRNGKVKTLAVDHDHETGKVRGLLCVACNTGIGKFADDRERMLAAVRYLDKHSSRESVVTPLRIVDGSAA